MILQKARVYMVGKIRRFPEPRKKADFPLQDLHVALNYGQQTGSAQLLRFITEHTEVKKFPGNTRMAAHAFIRLYITLLTRIGNAA